ncbi:hypothetical protein KR018_005905, partial [Drosophila ironensis]
YKGLFLQKPLSIQNSSMFTWEEICNLASDVVYSRVLVQYVDYLKIAFCFFKVPTISIFGVIAALITMIYFSLLHMLTKYFFMPNLMTLIDDVPMTYFGSCYCFFGLVSLVPNYLGDSTICNPVLQELSVIQFSQIIGEMMRSLVVGFMLISSEGCPINGVTIWSSMAFIMVMMAYLQEVCKHQYKTIAYALFQDPYRHLVLFRSMVFLVFFVLVIIMVIVVSHENFRHIMTEKVSQETFSDMDSDDEILGNFQKTTEYTGTQLWLNAVNGYKNMKDYHPCYRIIMLPAYTIAAHCIPVMTQSRVLYGWCKYISCFSLVVFPFMTVPVIFEAKFWTLLTFVCWGGSLLVMISTHSNRKPNHDSMFALMGVIVCSITIGQVDREMQNLMWQYLHLRYEMRADQMAMMFFGFGTLFCEAIVVNTLLERKWFGSALGVVMSKITYSTCLAFPVLYYQRCYNPKNQLTMTASTETTLHFLFLIVTFSLIHISMSGFEIRLSLFYYIFSLAGLFVAYQWLIHYNWVHPLASLYKVQHTV